MPTEQGETFNVRATAVNEGDQVVDIAFVQGCVAARVSTYEISGYQRYS
ncbi:hypothetical protein QVA66_09700 [Staphylococcus chromogenes]|nr:hypothetical protein [Staphylococcus chromogenes]